MSDVRFWVRRYLGEGWSPIPIPAGEKGPRTDDWKTKLFDEHDFAADDNIGVHLGRPAPDGSTTALYDVDLDAREALVAADMLLPNTPRVSGRKSKPRSHRWFTCDEPIQLEQFFGLGGQNDMIVELRGLDKKGEATQTVVPPSVRKASDEERAQGKVDEEVAWDGEGPPMKVPADLLRRAVRNVAIAVLLARHFPGPGHRHHPRMAMAGFLFRAGLEEKEVLQIGKTVMRLVRGDEKDWHDTARSTIEKIKAGEEGVTGGPTLRQALDNGEAVIKRLNKWLGREQQAAVDEVVETLNQHYFILEIGEKMAIADTTREDKVRLWDFAEFRKKFCKEFMPSTTGPKGQPKKGRPIVDVWIEHPRGRRQAELVYAPPGSKVKVNPNDFNGWRGLRVEPEARPWPLIGSHLLHVICRDDEDLYGWLLNWCAALVQNPGQHAWTALILRGGQGTGKGFFAHDLLGGLFDRRHYVHIYNREQFYGRFNDILSGRCLVFLDEATWGGDKTDAGVLKGRVTSDDLLIERKHLPALTERSMLHMILASNEDWPVGIDRDDRRFAAFNLSNEHANQSAYFTPLYQELKDGGQAGFLHDLLNSSVDDDMLRHPPSTVDKDELKIRSLPAEAAWWLDRLNEGKTLQNEKGWKQRVIRTALYAEYIQAMQNVGQGRRLNQMHFGRALKKFCPSLEAARQGAGPREYLFPKLDQARREFNEYLGTKETWDDGQAPPANPSPQRRLDEEEDPF